MENTNERPPFIPATDDDNSPVPLMLERAQLEARIAELTEEVKRRERVLDDAATVEVPLKHLRYWRDRLDAALSTGMPTDAQVRRTRDLIDTTLQKAIEQAHKDRAMAKVAEMAASDAPPSPCAEGNHQWQPDSAKAGVVPTSTCVRCSARRLDASPQDLYGRSADQ